MGKPGTRHDKQLDIWSSAVRVAVEYIQGRANGGDEAAKRTLVAIMAILYENETE